MDGGRSWSLDFPQEDSGGNLGLHTDSQKGSSKHKAVYKEKVHSQGGRASNFHEVELALGCLGIVCCVSRLGGAGMYNRVGSNGGCF